MNIAQIKLLLQQPLPIILNKVKTIVIEKAEGFYWAKKYTSNELRRPTSSVKFNSGLVDINKITTDNLDKEVVDYLTSMYLNHRFDLLGTGWVKNSYQSEAVGLEGIKFDNQLIGLKIDKKGNWLKEIVTSAHLELSKNIWTVITNSNQGYDPIDWQKDYKVGFRFSAKLPYNKQRSLIKSEGIDLKVPWELSRLQHLPQLALFAKQLPERKREILLEYKNQVLDFIMANPPGIGVNWNCTMDVGIRVANMLLAFDWFSQLDDKKVLDKYFENLLLEYLYNHGKHIVNNFEYKEGLTSNHYLGNIAGLTFVSIYLIGTKELDEWLMLSLQELSNELPKQFFNDGSNFEGSTAYHRLSGEMFTYCTALFNAIPDSRKKQLENIKSKKGLKKPFLNKSLNDFDLSSGVFNSEHYNLLVKMTLFSMAYRKADGSITQIGDNDSGRFFRLSPCGEFLSPKKAFEKYQNLAENKDYDEDKYWDENQINHDTFLAVLNGFVNNDELKEHSDKYSVEYSFIKQLMQKEIALTELQKYVVNKEIPDLPFKVSKELEFSENSESLIEQIKFDYFPDFGMLTFRSDRLYLNVTFGNNENSHHSWGHQHNDKLSVEINVDGKDIVFDPGTYIYTPLPAQRNLFRSTKSHNSIYTDEEQNEFAMGRNGLFNLNRDAKIEVLQLSNTTVSLSAKYRGTHHIRQIKIMENSILIKDSCNKKFIQTFNSNLFSNGYGKWVNL